MTKVVLKMGDKYKVMKFIESVCHMVPDKDYAKYDEGWSDIVIVDKYRKEIPGINKSHVSNLRQEMGLLLPKATVLHSAVYRINMNLLAKRVSELEVRVAALKEQFTKPLAEKKSSFVGLKLTPPPKG
jgi:hypothetical protein